MAVINPHQYFVQESELFLDRQVTAQFHSSFQNDVENDQLYLMIRNNKLLWKLCHIPSILRLICTAKEQFLKVKCISQYAQIILTESLKKHFTVEEDTLLFLEHCALTGFVEVDNKQATLDYLFELKGLDQKELIVPQSKIGLVIFEWNGYKIVHPILQDYFVAKFLIDCMGDNPKHNFDMALKHAKVPKKSLDQFIIQHVFLSPYAMIFLKELASDTLLDRIEKLVSEPNLTDTDINEYIDFYFTKGGDKIRTTLYAHPPLLEACRTPIFLRNICRVCGRLSDCATPDEVYIIRMVLSSILAQYMIEFKSIDRDSDFSDGSSDFICTNEILFLEYSAFASFLKVEPTLEYLQEITGITTPETFLGPQKYIGLVNKANKIINPMLQDYFVARFLVSCLSNKSTHNFTKALEHAKAPILSIDQFLAQYIKGNSILTFITKYIYEDGHILSLMKGLTKYRNMAIYEKL